MNLSKKILSALQKISETYNPQKGRWRLSSVAYTLIHKWAFLKREKYILGKNTPAGFLHDWEKPLMYLVPKVTDNQIQKLHQKLQPHHTGSPRQTRVDHLLELYIDWDSSAITKPDKPLNPYATLLYFHPKSMNRILPLLLAVNPQQVSPFVQDMDYARKQNNPNYFFKNKELNRKLFTQTKKLINQINSALEHLDMQKFNPDYLPEFLSEMTPADIFLKATYLLAQKRHQIVDTKKMRELVKEITASFNKQTTFQCNPLPAKKIAQNETHMPHPFLMETHSR